MLSPWFIRHKPKYAGSAWTQRNCTLHFVEIKCSWIANSCHESFSKPSQHPKTLFSRILYCYRPLPRFGLLLCPLDIITVFDHCLDYWILHLSCCLNCSLTIATIDLEFALRICTCARTFIKQYLCMHFISDMDHYRMLSCDRTATDTSTTATSPTMLPATGKQQFLQLESQMQQLSGVPKQERYDGDPGKSLGFYYSAGYISTHMLAWTTKSSLHNSWTSSWVRHCHGLLHSGKEILIWTVNLLMLKQGSIQATEYSLDFCTLAAGSGWNHATLWVIYRHGLACRDEALLLDSLIHLSIKLDNILRET